MHRNYFKIAWRNLFKYKGYSLINIGGLSLGMAVAILIGLWLWEEISYNKYHHHYDRIAQVIRQVPDQLSNEIQPTGLGTVLKNEYSNHFERVVLIRGRIEERAIATREKNFLQKGYFMQPEGAEMLSLRMKYGSRKGLQDMNSILLSSSLAEKLFGQDNPLGKTITMDTQWPLEVTGVYEDLPENSDFNEASYFAPLGRYLDGWSSLNVWNNYNMYLFVQIKPEASFANATDAIKEAMIPHIDEKDMEVILHPWQEWQYTYENGMQVTSKRFVAILMIGSIGVFIIILACINFVNLSTARSEKRAKEVGIRKTIGSLRRQLVAQFMSESLLTAVISFVMAFGLVSLTLPWFNQIAGKTILLPLDQPVFWILLVSFVLLTGVLAGGYPAFYLSSFKPLKALKGTFKAGPKAAIPRKVLVVLQFTVSISLIIGTIIIYQQIQLAQNRPVGYSPQGLLTLPIRSAEIYNQFGVLQNELKRTGVVIEIAASNYPITSAKGWNGGFEWSDKDPAFDPSFNIMQVTPEYGQTVGLEFVSGRDFSGERASDDKAIIINESSVKQMGLEEPVGQTVRWNHPEFDRQENYTIIGVVKDQVKASPFQSTFPAIIFNSNEVSELLIRIDPAVGVSQALPEIQSVFEKVVPSVPFDYKFVDQEYNKKFAAEVRIGKLAGIFTFFAIFISSIGLFGLVSFVAGQRTKEIGIRKVLGASVLNLWRTLTKDFFLLVFISFVIAVPLAWFFLDGWLQGYEYRTKMHWWIFGLAGGLSAVITVFTVGFQTVKAALINPVEALRSE